MKKIILIGAGGQAKSCIDVINLTKNYKIVGFIDIKKKKKILNYKVLGNEQYLKKLNKKQDGKLIFAICLPIGLKADDLSGTFIFFKILVIGFSFAFLAISISDLILLINM